ncbi:hypothetical protein [Bacillus cereus]
MSVLLNEFQIKPEEIACIGDSYNETHLIKQKWQSLY